jgi:hypothetical protein
MNRFAAILVVLAACATSYDYDPATAGEGEGSGRPLVAKTSSQFVRTLYADLVGRNPESFTLQITVNGTPAVSTPVDEQSTIVTVLDGLGDSQPMRNLIADGMLHGAEVSLPAKADVPDPRAYITEQFERLLGRDPNVYELETFANAWQTDDAVGPRTIIRAIVGSREYQAH